MGSHDNTLGTGDHEAAAAPAHAAVAEADGKALEEAWPPSSIQVEFRDNKSSIGDHEAARELDFAAVAAAAGKLSEET